MRGLAREIMPLRAQREFSRPAILAVTADLCFYSSIVSAVGCLGWHAEWASSMNLGLEICGAGLVQIVVYDRNLPNVDWRYAIDRLSAISSRPRVLVAASHVDEDLWRTVLRRRGYDVVARSADSEQLRRELRFAWLSLQTNS
jgi:DNA-binding response OmpR family regulator